MCGGKTEYFRHLLFLNSFEILESGYLHKIGINQKL